jgi:hypothetical protein
MLTPTDSEIVISTNIKEKQNKYRKLSRESQESYMYMQLCKNIGGITGYNRQHLF